jgi:hypothetical protein
MPKQKNEVSPVTAETEEQETTETPRPKTPLELVRERQAKMSGQKPVAGRGSGETEKSGPADSYKRRLHQRKSG